MLFGAAYAQTEIIKAGAGATTMSLFIYKKEFPNSKCELEVANMGNSVAWLVWILDPVEKNDDLICPLLGAECWDIAFSAIDIVYYGTMIAQCRGTSICGDTNCEPTMFWTIFDLVYSSVVAYFGVYAVKDEWNYERGYWLGLQAVDLAYTFFEFGRAAYDLNELI